MATVRFGAIVTGIVGKVGGQVFRRKRASTTLLNAIASSAKLTKADAGRVFPPKQIIAEVSGGWRLLTDAQRLGWNTGAVNWPAQNRYGETYTPSGFQVFMKMNTQINNLTGIMITDIPLPVSIPELQAATFDVPDEVDFNIDYTGAIPASWVLRVSATQSVGSALVPKKSFFKIIAQFPSGVTFPQNLSDGYKEIYGQWLNNSTVWIRIELVSILTGQKGVAQDYKVPIAF